MAFRARLCCLISKSAAYRRLALLTDFVQTLIIASDCFRDRFLSFKAFQKRWKPSFCFKTLRFVYHA
jgi:hypothetical protein